MTHQEMFGNAKWITSPYEDAATPQFRGTFFANNISHAKIRICGLGYFALWLNGKRVSDDLLVPANSNYSERNLTLMEYPILDALTHRIYVLEYDIAAYLREGENAIGVVLGTGWYAQSLRWAEGDVAFGRCKLCYQITMETDNGTVCVISDENLRWSPGACTFSNIYYGEHYDFTLAQDGFSLPDFDDSAWGEVQITETPQSALCIQTCPPDRVIRHINPKVLRVLEDETVYDCGENITGHAVVAAKTEQACVTVCYAEEIYEDQTLDYSSCGGIKQIQTNQYNHCKAGAACAPEFTWHGFRYFSVSNNADLLRVHVVHADTPVTSAFDSDSLRLNWLYDAYVRTQLCNMHGGVPSDCPHIERLGYTGDGQLCAQSAMLLLDSREFYRKWLQDIADCQNKENGHVQHTAPFAGGGGGPSAWGGAIVVVPYMFYKQFGEIETLREFLPQMLHYFEYMQSRSDNGLIYREEEGGWCLGDWCTPGGIQIPETFVNSCLLVKFMETAQEIAAILGEPERCAHLSERIALSRQSILRAYYSPQTHNFMGNLQGANSFGLDIGLGDEKTFQNMLQFYKERGEYDTGIVGTDILTRLLFERGEAELAFRLLTSQGDNSFYNMEKQGATTLWEYWDGTRSHSHPMFGAVTRLLFMHLLGIGQAADSAGYAKIVIAPQLVPDLNRASGHVETIRGKIAVSYEKQGENVHFCVSLAPGMDGIFRLGSEELPLCAGETIIKAEGEKLYANKA